MPEFAQFSTPHVRLPRLAGIGLVVRDATFDDLDAIAELAAWREGVDIARQREMLERSFAKPDTTLTVATFEGRLAGFGRTAYLRRPPDPPPNSIPDGWYLTGVVVHPDMRRRGVGEELTRWRLDLLFDRAATVYYFATAINRPTIALHERLGFREIARDIWAPGSTFTGGIGVLFELTREEWNRRR